jgi:hypothetical protein
MFAIFFHLALRTTIRSDSTEVLPSMTNSPNLVLWTVTSLLNVGGVVAAAHAFNTRFVKNYARLLWLIPALVLASWLASFFDTSIVAQIFSLTTVVLSVRGIATNLLAYAILGLVFLLLRRAASKRFAAQRTVTPTPSREPASGSGLRETVESFLSAADTANVDLLATAYAPDFACIRVADAGGFIQLTADQMLSFLRRATAGQSAARHAVPTQSTKIHHTEILGDSAIVLLTRIKDLGSGWEPLFYTLLWKREAGAWHLQREIVHQKSAPNWA